MKKEIWKDIKGYEGLYQISNLGRVKSLKRIIKRKNNLLSIKERILKPAKSKKGRLSVAICKDGKQNSYYVHKLVAEAFLNKKDFKCMSNEDKNKINLNELEINHKDENIYNNYVSNLEYCTRKYNINYGTHNERVSKSLSGRTNKKLCKKINQYDLDGNFIKTWNSIAEIRRNLAIFNIEYCCQHKRKKSGGYVWEYFKEVEEEI